jgi:hypothetical protein
MTMAWGRDPTDDGGVINGGDGGEVIESRFRLVRDREPVMTDLDNLEREREREGEGGEFFLAPEKLASMGDAMEDPGVSGRGSAELSCKLLVRRRDMLIPVEDER